MCVIPHTLGYQVNRGDQVGKMFEKFWKINIFRLTQHCKVIEKKVGWIIRFKKEMESSLFTFSNVTTQILLNVIVLFSRFNPNSTY